MNILVTGANGQLGTELRNVSAGAPDRYIFTDVTSLPGVDTVYLDITNRDAVRLICDSEQVDVIVNCAAYTNVDKAEDDVQMADLLNHIAPGILAGVAAERGAHLIHISTDYVFQGDIALPCREDWPVHPNGVYGATKLQGEQAVQDAGCSWQIFRTAWLYSPYGKNFVKTMRQLTAERPTLKVVCSWFDFACAIRDLSGHICNILPCHSDEFPSKVRRPHFSVLDKTKVKETFGVAVPHWFVSLKQCIDRL